MSRMTYEEACIPYDAALDELTKMHLAWPATPFEDLIKFSRGEIKSIPNEVAWQEARTNLINKYLEGTGWTEEEIEAENDKRVNWGD